MLVGESELSAENKQIYHRAQLIKSYMTQPFVAMEGQTGVKGVYVSREETVRDVLKILDGTCDAMSEHDLLMIGAMNE